MPRTTNLLAYFRNGESLGKGFQQAQVYTVHLARVQPNITLYSTLKFRHNQNWLMTYGSVIRTGMVDLKSIYSTPWNLTTLGMLPWMLASCLLRSIMCKRCEQCEL